MFEFFYRNAFKTVQTFKKLIAFIYWIWKHRFFKIHILINGLVLQMIFGFFDLVIFAPNYHTRTFFCFLDDNTLSSASPLRVSYSSFVILEFIHGESLTSFSKISFSIWLKINPKPGWKFDLTRLLLANSSKSFRSSGSLRNLWTAEKSNLSPKPESQYPIMLFDQDWKKF